MHNYVQVNSLRLKSSVASKWTSKHLWARGVAFILLLMVQNRHSYPYKKEIRVDDCFEYYFETK